MLLKVYLRDSEGYVEAGTNTQAGCFLGVVGNEGICDIGVIYIYIFIHLFIHLFYISIPY